jgi:thiopeptide-type bacteriocin biosynthesis protein
MGYKLSDFEIHKKFVLRTPLLSWTEIEKLLQAGSIEETIAHIKKWYADESVKHALYIASPTVFSLLEKWQNGQEIKDESKLIFSLIKYLMRMSTRSTPFGLFAGVSMGNWSDKTDLVIVDRDAITVNANMDMNYLFEIKNALLENKSIAAQIKWFTNPTVYIAGDYFKFIDAVYNGNARKYGLSVAARTEHLSATLDFAKNGTSLNELCRSLLSDEIEEDEALEFIDSLIDKQILLSELEPIFGNADYFNQLQRIIRSLPPAEQAANIKDFDHLNSVLDSLKVNRNWSSALYQSMLFRNTKPKHDTLKTFQVDYTRRLNKAELNQKYLKDIRRGLDVLNKLSRFPDTTSITNFKRSFYERYENAEVPLLNALDPELGINYSNANIKDFTPFLDNLFFDGKNSAARSIEWTSIDSFLMKKMISACLSKQFEVEITDEELQPFESNWDRVPDTFTVVASLAEIKKNGNEQEFIHLIGGVSTSAANIFARFTMHDEGLCSLAEEFTNKEQAAHSNEVIAELAYLPDRTGFGNILQGEIHRGYYVPFLSSMFSEKSEPIRLDDLMLSIKHGRLVIRSRSLNKYVRLKLTHSFNYSLDTHPLYHFIGDLQFQDLHWPVIFDWGPLVGEFIFLPRVLYGNLVLSPATWLLNEEHTKPFRKNGGGQAGDEVLLKLKAEWQLPARFMVSEHDNHLLIDLDNPLSIELFKSILAKKSLVKITEFLPPSRSSIIDAHSQSYKNEICVFFSRKTEQLKEEFVAHRSGRETTRNYVPGSEWLYIKLYAGTKGADTLLLDVIRKVAHELMVKGLVDKWFFIRYYDTDYHLRIRFHLVSGHAEVLSALHKLLSPYSENKILHRFSIDTYVRELERYGASTIDEAETIFFIDSQFTLAFLDFIKNNEQKENYRWMYLFVAADAMLDDFGLSIDEKYEWAKMHDKAKPYVQRNQELSDKFREDRSAIFKILQREEITDPNWQTIFEMIKMKSRSLVPVCKAIIELNRCGKMESNMNAFISSCIHLMVNRVCLTRPNDHEHILFNFLFKYYSYLKSKSSNVSL